MNWRMHPVGKDDNGRKIVGCSQGKDKGSKGPHHNIHLIYEQLEQKKGKKIADLKLQELHDTRQWQDVLGAPPMSDHC